jgi:hypothetical protein
MGLQASPWRGCPIRTSPDQSLLAAPRGLSQPATSFIGSWCQGIHRAPLLARRLDLSTSPSRQDQRSSKRPNSLLRAHTPLGREPSSCLLKLLFSSSSAPGSSTREPDLSARCTPAAKRSISSASPSPGRGPSTSGTPPRCTCSVKPPRPAPGPCVPDLVVAVAVAVVLHSGHKNGPTSSSRRGTRVVSERVMRLLAPTRE